MTYNKNTIQTLRLLFGAEKAKSEKSKILPEYASQIEAWRDNLRLMSGTEVFDAVTVLLRSGLSFELDVKAPMINIESRSDKTQRLRDPGS